MMSVVSSTTPAHELVCYLDLDRRGGSAPRESARRSVADSSAKTTFSSAKNCPCGGQPDVLPSSTA